MKFYILFAFHLICSFNIQAADSTWLNIEPISTDRPDQTESPSTLPFKFFQMEIGMNIESEEKELQFVLPTILWRVGIFKSTELRLTTDVISFKDNTQRYKVGLSPIGIGFKTAICEERKARPAIAFIGNMEIPYLSTKNVRTTYFAPSFKFAFEHSLPKNISLGYNGGMEWDGYSPHPTFIYTLVNGFSVKEKWYLYYEFFGGFPIKEKSTHSFDVGVAYGIKNNMQLDLSGGMQLYPFAKAWYASLGYSFRIPH